MSTLYIGNVFFLNVDLAHTDSHGVDSDGPQVAASKTCKTEVYISFAVLQ